MQRNSPLLLSMSSLKIESAYRDYEWKRGKDVLTTYSKEYQRQCCRHSELLGRAVEAREDEEME